MIHLADEGREALTADFLSEKYGELNKKYYGEALTFDPDIANEWARIPALLLQLLRFPVMRRDSPPRHLSRMRS